MGPPPPQPPSFKTPIQASASSSRATPKAPVVSPSRPTGSMLMELITYNGSPFKDHWAYFMASSTNSDLGVYIHATGSVLGGFELEIKRSYDLVQTYTKPSKRLLLQWIDAKFVDEAAMLNEGEYKQDRLPVCAIEQSLLKIKAPEKSLHSANRSDTPTKKVIQRNCQTWIVEAADQLVRDGILHAEVAEFLHAIEQ